MPRVRDVTERQPSSPDSDLLLAVDAGGTKTAAWLVDSGRGEDDRVLGRGRTTAGNPLSVGFEESTRAIAEAIDAARNDAGQHGRDRVGRIILSIAGAANRDMSQRFATWVHETNLADHVAIVSDILPVLAAGTPNCCGVALIAGTGSFAIGRAADGRTARCGGWGYLLGDEGSGYDVGLTALHHTLRDLESGKQWEPNSLTEAVVRALDVKSVMELTKAIYTSADPRRSIASIAPLVVVAAEKGETTARAILDWAATELGELVSRVVDLIGFDETPIPLGVGGGLLASSHLLREELQVWLQRFKIDCKMTVVENPLAGCVRLADPECVKDLVTWQ